MYATFRYHPIEAPTGRKFTDDAAFAALGPDWVDTPAKFPPREPERVINFYPEVVASNDDIRPKRRGRPPKEAA